MNRLYKHHHHYILYLCRHILQHLDRKSTRLNSSHSQISYAVFCLKKKKKNKHQTNKLTIIYTHITLSITLSDTHQHPQYIVISPTTNLMHDNCSHVNTK